MTEHLLESIEGGIATLTMNRPEARNAMSGEMMGALREAVDRVAADPNVRCLVLTGAGGAFCAGGDVKGQARAASARASAGRVSVAARVQGLRSGMELSRLLHEMPKPTLAVIPGAAAGAGLSLALACDLRIALDTAKLTTAPTTPKALGSIPINQLAGISPRKAVEATNMMPLCWNT